MSCLAISKGIKATICEINNFPIVTSIYLNIVVHNWVEPKTFVEKFSFCELKIEKVKILTQNLTKFYCINVFKVGDCLASCLTFRSFLTLDP